jgi:TetR/AcrR family transcriptional regulator of autoinduction and epiphytic fitness
MTSLPDGPGAAGAALGRLDGRTARAQRTREAVVDALLALQEEGDLAPTAQRVAERAGVALRTVFGHFSDMETLWAEAGRRELAKLGALAEVVPADLPLAERIDRFARSRARVLEALLPVMRAARLREPFSPQLLRNRAAFIAAGDEQVAAVFAAELAPLDAPARAALLDALYLASSGPAWEALRHERALSVDGATAVVRRTVRALLSPGGLP